MAVIKRSQNSSDLIHIRFQKVGVSSSAVLFFALDHGKRVGEECLWKKNPKNN